MKERLTERQNEAFEFIRSFIDERDLPPTLREIGKGLGLRSTNAVYKLLRSLEEKGYIERQEGAARGLRITEEAEDPFFSAEPSAPQLPVIGKMTSFEADSLLDNPVGFLTIDARLLRRARNPDRCLIARAGDDGLNDEDIRKGDFLLIEEMPTDAIPADSIVAALVRRVLQPRRFKLHQRHLYLYPAAQSYSETSFPIDDPGCHIIGPIRGVLRTI